MRAEEARLSPFQFTAVFFVLTCILMSPTIRNYATFCLFQWTDTQLWPIFTVLWPTLCSLLIAAVCVVVSIQSEQQWAKSKGFHHFSFRDMVKYGVFHWISVDQTTLLHGPDKMSRMIGENPLIFSCKQIASIYRRLTWLRVKLDT